MTGLDTPQVRCQLCDGTDVEILDVDIWDSGLPEPNRLVRYRFNGAAHDPWNLPADVFDMRAAFQWDLDMICHRAEGLVLLDGWHTSAGAQLEVDVADKLDLPKWAVEQIPEIPWGTGR